MAGREYIACPHQTHSHSVSDGWYRFIYEVYEQSRLPWVYGGEYEAFGRCIVQVVEAWIAIGLRVYFVFDGGTSSFPATLPLHI